MAGYNTLQSDQRRRAEKARRLLAREYHTDDASHLDTVDSVIQTNGSFRKKHFGSRSENADSGKDRVLPLDLGGLILPPYEPSKEFEFKIGKFNRFIKNICRSGQKERY